jgi:hypothetical protein
MRRCRDCRWFLRDDDGGHCRYPTRDPVPWWLEPPPGGWPRTGSEDASECEDYEDYKDETVD